MENIVYMNFFLDCEFDIPSNQLISVGIVSEDGNREFYEVVEHPNIQDEWVMTNVIPILGKKAISRKEYQANLVKWCSQFVKMNIIVNHPNDLVFFNSSLICGDVGEWLELPPLTFVVDRDLSGKGSKLIHNALADAVSTREDWLRKQQMSIEEY